MHIWNSTNARFVLIARGLLQLRQVVSIGYGTIESLIFKPSSLVVTIATLSFRYFKSTPSHSNGPWKSRKRWGQHSSDHQMPRLRQHIPRYAWNVRPFQDTRHEKHGKRRRLQYELWWLQYWPGNIWQSRVPHAGHSWHCKQEGYSTCTVSMVRRKVQNNSRSLHAHSICTQMRGRPTWCCGHIGHDQYDTHWKVILIFVHGLWQSIGLAEFVYKSYGHSFGG